MWSPGSSKRLGQSADDVTVVPGPAAARLLPDSESAFLHGMFT
jgi:hypothetical protein